MAGFKDALLVLTSYPEITSHVIIDYVLDLSKEFGLHISALVPSVTRERVAPYYTPSERIAGIPELVDAAVARSQFNVGEIRSLIEKGIAKRGLSHDTIVTPSHIFPSADMVIPRARLSDFIFLPIYELVGLEELYFESIIFGSGRSTMLLPAEEGFCRNKILPETVCVAFDFSRPAARALGDAMPLLEAAHRVHVVTVLGEKTIDNVVSWEELRMHLLRHGISAQRDEINSEGRPIGDVLRQYVETIRADLLVMGAFGHSRLVEFVLGGATRNILNKPPVPVLLSH